MCIYMVPRSIPVPMSPCTHPVIPLVKIHREGSGCAIMKPVVHILRTYIKPRWMWQPIYNLSTEESQTGIPRAS